MENNPKDYGSYFKERFGRTATKEDLSNLLDRLFNNLPATETALVPVKQEDPLSYLVQGIQESSPEITPEKIDNALSAMYEEEQEANYSWLGDKLGKLSPNHIAGAVLGGLIALTVGITYFGYQKVKRDAYEFEPTESLTKVEASSTLPKEILDAYAERHNLLETKLSWSGPEETIFDETINDARIVAKTFLSGRHINGGLMTTFNDFLVLYQYGPTGLVSMHFYDGSWNNDQDEIVDDAKPFTSIFFNRGEGDSKGKEVIEAGFYDEYFQEHYYHGKVDADHDGWGGVTYYSSAIPEGKIEPYYDLSEKFLEEFKELYEEYSWKRSIVINPP